MKRARDVRDQLEGLLERVEIDVVSNLSDTVAIRKVVCVQTWQKVVLKMHAIVRVGCCMTGLKLNL